MDILNSVMFVSEYIGVIVGAILLLIATLFLPSKLRWYVLTAGLSIVAFRSYQIFYAKRKIAKIDAKVVIKNKEHQSFKQEQNDIFEESLKLDERVGIVKNKINMSKSEQQNVLSDELEQEYERLTKDKKALIARMKIRELTLK